MEGFWDPTICELSFRLRTSGCAKQSSPEERGERRLFQVHTHDGANSDTIFLSTHNGLGLK